MPARRPSISVIVCTRGRAELLPDCLKSLAAALTTGDELIVVESGDRHGATALDRMGAVVPTTAYVHVDQPGKSRQLNLGVRRARGEVLLFTDDDVRVGPSWPDQMAAGFSDPRVGIAFGRVTGLTMAPVFAGPEVIPTGEAPLETWRYAHGAAMAIRASAIAAAGGFDERLGPGAPAHGEEHDILLRLRQRRWLVMLAGAAPVQHLDWRTEQQQRSNALVYERGSGAMIGAALRRTPREGLRLFKYRLAYQRSLLASDRHFGRQALTAFAGGLVYGLRLKERNWLR